MKKILIVYATAGIGHKKAALAVKAALDETAAGRAEVTIIDALDYTNAFFKWFYLWSYLTMVSQLPTFWGLMYYLTDNKLVNVVVSRLRRLSNWLNSGRLRRYLAETKPDVIVSTHFFASEVIADMKMRGATDARLVTVVTDYRLHSWWVNRGTDIYVVGGDGARKDLLGWGVEPLTIKILGIPVEPVFSKELSPGEAAARVGLDRGVFTVLVLGGGFGVGPIEKIVEIVDAIPQKAQIAVVCGHNEELVRRLESRKASFKHKVVVAGFVNNVYEYMQAADLLISKSGGITSTESMAKNLPLIIIAPIIGQETRNSDYLTGEGAALKIRAPRELTAIFEGIAADPAKLRAMRESISRIRRPRACYDVACLALEI